MAPLIAGALGLAIDAAPQIIKWIAGDDSKAAKAAEEAAGIAKAVTGKGDLDEAMAALRADPAAFLQFKAQMAANAVAMVQAEAAADDQAERNVTDRSARYEGTARDLLQAGFAGRVMLFVRGSIRPVFALGVGYADLMVWSGRWQLVPESWTEMTFFLANGLVLGFWFGERALKNLLPTVIEFMGRRAAGKRA